MKGMGSGLPPIKEKFSKSMEIELIENPFKLSSDDKKLQATRGDEKLKKLAGIESDKSTKIWERSQIDTISRKSRLNELLGITGKCDDGGDEKFARTEEPKVVIHRRQEKESMPEFIAKKREMFLVQMSLDTKREEIRKLEEKAQMKEEALLRSEHMLEEDAMRFDSFLKENDKKAHDAIKRAEEETKKKQEKTFEIKKLSQQIQDLNSEMNKNREALDDCLRYKAFLDALTPPEWFEQHKQNMKEARERAQRVRYESKYQEWEKMKKRVIEQHRKEADAKRGNVGRRRSAMQNVEEAPTVEDDQDWKSVIPPAPKLEDEIIEVVEEEPPMYFKHPQQLMDIFSALEEQNLFLIQNSQETEHTLEELQHAFKHTKMEMEAQSGQLQEQIQELRTQISVENNRAKTLQQKRLDATAISNAPDTSTAAAVGGATRGVVAVATGGSGEDVEKERLLSELNTKVRFVYEQCKFPSSSRPSTIFMLAQLEAKLESLLIEIEKMPVDYVMKAEKEKEKIRRERKREEQQRQQERMQEERNRRAIERSMQAPKKRVGRQVMYRSRPIRKELVTDDDDKDKENNDEIKYLS